MGSGSVRFVGMVPSPSWPYWWAPQHLTLPSSSSTHECNPPTSTLLTLCPAPRSTAGRRSPISLAESPRLAKSVRPSSPSGLIPQHLTLPTEASSAQVELLEAASVRAVAPVPRSRVGMPVPPSRGLVPAAPMATPIPQQATCPASPTTQVCCVPRARNFRVTQAPTRHTGFSFGHAEVACQTPPVVQTCGLLALQRPSPARQPSAVWPPAPPVA